MIELNQIDDQNNNNINRNKSKMKGSTLRYNYVKALNFMAASQKISDNDLAIIQTKTTIKQQAKPSQINEKRINSGKLGKTEHKIAKTIPINPSKQREFACLSPRQTTPIMAKHYTKTLSQSENKLNQRPSTLISKEMQRYMQIQDKSIRLSLSHFQDKMKSISLDKKIERIEQNAINLKLEGINCKITRTKSAHKNNNLDVSHLFQKQSAIYLTQHHHQQTSIQPQKILSKIETQTYRPLSEFNSHSRQIIAINRRHHMTSAMSRRTIASRNIESARQRAKVNIINMIDGAPFQKKRKSNQIFAQIYQADQTITPKNNESKKTSENLIIKIELYDELNQIRKQIDNRKAINNKHLLPRKKQIKYTTNLIEQRLNRRKSLMKNYTFKRTPTQAKGKCVAVDDFHVQGWNNQQIDHKEAIVA